MLCSIFIAVILGLLTTVTALFNDPLKVLDVGEDKPLVVRESEKLALRRRGVRFIDISKHGTLPWGKKYTKFDEIPVYNYPNQLTNGKEFQELASFINGKELYDNLAKFTSFFTRYYKSQHGYDSAKWLSSRINETVAGLSENAVLVEHHYHEGWMQFSISVRVIGIETPENIIMIGSHQDSMNLLFPSWIAAPGADDNGSGTVTVLEALRVYSVILRKGYQPKNSVEFHFFSAEEGGLLGSFDVFSKYREAGKSVVAMLQQDMTGYVPDMKDEHVSIVTDFTSEALNDFLKIVIDTYLLIPFKESTCGYACSDHGSAIKNGFPASFVLESVHAKTNKYIHTTMDTIDRLNFDHMKEHVKLVLGFIIELDNWKVERK
ncbi:hypothetical protein HG535_0D04840 [Zygotorulaspora mrakii]|uniref:Peptide hydrolase n=1 Tax=Zygotorulaspora mrakii TaxID=42260 RepID=A0A7H9B294_ZYGMR|nr:uncharacterized protein HG535_0D04840 [Zygotorulaspora mrakii]QLG72775.1 hypothetical protein HG535_0D04840 [Zygotorulaspora mrakii]